jgi:hypothetical protein
MAAVAAAHTLAVVVHTSAAAECVAVAGDISAAGCVAAARISVVAECGTSAAVVVTGTSAVAVVSDTSAAAAFGTLAAGPQAPDPVREQFLVAAAERRSAPTAATGRLAAIATQISDPAPYAAR